MGFGSMWPPWTWRRSTRTADGSTECSRGSQGWSSEPNGFIWFRAPTSASKLTHLFDSISRLASRGWHLVRGATDKTSDDSISRHLGAWPCLQDPVDDAPEIAGLAGMLEVVADDTHESHTD